MDGGAGAPVRALPYRRRRGREVRMLGDDPGVSARPHGGARSGGRPIEAACAYWRRRGLATEPEQVLFAPGGAVALLSVLGALGPGGVLLPRPSSQWHGAQARMLGRDTWYVPTPAECGGVPDPFALQEAVRRQRRRGGDPRALVLSVADEVTGTAVPPELLHEVCEVASVEGLLVISDETWRDTGHSAHDTVIVSPAEILERQGGGPPTGEAVLVVDLSTRFRPQDSGTAGAAVVRFPPSAYGRELREATARALRALGAVLPERRWQDTTVVLTEPEPLQAERRAWVRQQSTYALAVCEVLYGVGAHARPPRLGCGLYADLEPLRRGLLASGVTDSLTLEAHLTLAVGPWVRGGHRLGDDPAALRVWLGTGMFGPPGPRTPDHTTGLDAAARLVLAQLGGALPRASRDLEGRR